MGGVVNQIAAVQKRHDLHAVRQDAAVQLFLFRFDGLERRLRFRALAQEHDAFHHVVVVENPAVGSMDSPADLAEPDFGALDYSTDVGDAQRRSVLSLNYGLADIVDGAEKSQGAHVDLLQAGLDKTAAGIDVIVGQRLLHLAEIQTIGD